MTADEVAPARAVWRLGDYHRFAREQMWEIGPVLVAACGISPGQRVLDVAAGSGNVAIRAAQAGAEVVARRSAFHSAIAGGPAWGSARPPGSWGRSSSRSALLRIGAVTTIRPTR